MKKTGVFISLILIFVMLLAMIPAVKINADDVPWKQYLADFLIHSFPSLFDEEVKEKNNKAFQEMYEGIWEYYEDKNTRLKYYKDKSSGTLSPLSDHLSADIIKLEDYCRPTGCNFYDLDNDGIPEAVVHYAGYESCISWRNVYKLYGTFYEEIGSLSGGEYYDHLFIDSQNRIIVLHPDSMQLLEIKNKKIVYSEYIDSTGSDTYNGVKYSEIGTYTVFFDFIDHDKWLNDDVNTEVFLVDLKLIPQFDSLSVEELLNPTLTAPNTGNANTAVFIVLGLISVAAARRLKFRR